MIIIYLVETQMTFKLLIVKTTIHINFCSVAIEPGWQCVAYSSMASYTSRLLRLSQNHAKASGLAI